MAQRLAATVSFYLPSSGVKGKEEMPDKVCSSMWTHGHRLKSCQHPAKLCLTHWAPCALSHIIQERMSSGRVKAKANRMGMTVCRVCVWPIRLPGYKQVEHSQGHEGDADVKRHSHCSVLLEDLLQLLGLSGFCSLCFFWDLQ